MYSYTLPFNCTHIRGRTKKYTKYLYFCLFQTRTLIRMRQKKLSIPIMIKMNKRKTIT